MYTPARDNPGRRSKVKGVRFFLHVELLVFSCSILPQQLSASPIFFGLQEASQLVVVRATPPTHLLTIADCPNSVPEDALRAFDAM